MSEQFAKSSQNKFRSSKIQIAVKTTPWLQTSKNTTIQLNSDADGSDLTNE